jgi:AcrR family transcriptional regulator
VVFVTQRDRAQRGRRADRTTIARAALDLIDREGLEALSMRRVASELNVDPMMLYRSVPNREGMVRDVVGLLLDEIDITERPGATWDETLRRLHISEREMALRHPSAYPLLVLSPRGEQPVLGWAQRLMDLLGKGGLPRERFFDVWLVDASYTNGFLLLETAPAAQGPAGGPPAGESEGSGEFARQLTETASGDAFLRGLDLIYRGLRDALAGEGAAPR